MVNSSGTKSLRFYYENVKWQKRKEKTYIDIY